MEDQKIKADDGKAKLSLVPTEIMYAIARIREYGNAKYPDGGEDNVAFLCDFYAKRTGNTAKEADDGRTHMQEV